MLRGLYRLLVVLYLVVIGEAVAVVPRHRCIKFLAGGEPCPNDGGDIWWLLAHWTSGSLLCIAPPGRRRRCLALDKLRGAHPTDVFIASSASGGGQTRPRAAIGASRPCAPSDSSAVSWSFDPAVSSEGPHREDRITALGS